MQSVYKTTRAHGLQAQPKARANSKQARSARSYFVFIAFIKSMASKRKLVQEFDDVGVCSPSKSAKLEGVLTNLSPPMKSAEKYFHGRLLDDKGSIRIVGFDKNVQDKLMHFQEQKEPIVIENCEIVKSRYTDNMEVIVNRGTKFYKSKKSFDVTAEDIMTLADLTDQPIYECVNVKVKVIEMESPIEIQPSLKKQDVVIADHSGTARLKAGSQYATYTLRCTGRCIY